jgi:hypothetical protein
MDNSIPLKMKFMAKFVPYDVLLCYNRKIYTVRSDDNNMAISTVSSYKKLDYNKPFKILPYIILYNIILMKWLFVFKYMAPNSYIS